MIIEKNGKSYIVSESITKWTVKTDDKKLSFSFEVPKELCKTRDELREYVLSNDLF